MHHRVRLYGSMLGLAAYYSGVEAVTLFVHVKNYVPVAGAAVGVVGALALAAWNARGAASGAAAQAQGVANEERSQEVLGELQKTIHAVSESSTMLDQAANESAKTTESIAYTIGIVADGASQQADIIREVLANVAEVQTAIGQVSDHSQDVTSAGNRVFGEAEQGQQAVEAMVGEIRNIARIMKDATGTIDTLAKRSEAINQITNTIKALAEQTNLLALNAAIEAARAGDQGRGFAVVADEVRKLAEGSASSVDQINQIIRSTIQDTAAAQKAMMSATQAVEAGVGVASMAEESLKQIVSATTDSKRRVEDINGYIGQLNNIARALVHGVEKIAQVADSTAHKSQDVAAATQEQTASMEEMSANAAKLNQVASVLKHLVADLQTTT